MVGIDNKEVWDLWKIIKTQLFLQSSLVELGTKEKYISII